MRKIKFSITTILIIVLTTTSAFTFSLLGVVISRHMETSIRETANSYSTQLIYQIQYNLNSFFENINNTMYNFMATDTLVEALKSYEQDDAYTRLVNRKSIAQMISSYTKTRNEISNIFVFNQETVYSMNSTLFHHDTFTRFLLQTYPAQKYMKPEYYPVDYPYFYAQNSMKKEMIVTLPVRDYRGHDKKNYGLILASIRTDNLDELFAPLCENGFDVYILDGNDTVYYGSDTSTLASRYEFNTPDQLEEALPLNLHDWQVVITSDMSDMQQHLDSMHRTVITIVLISILLVSLMILYVSNRITWPLKYIAGQMATMNYDKLSQKLVPAESYKEISHLYDGYNNMLEKIQTLIDSVSYERLRQKEAHFEALQSKINPHFLYNTLQSIYSLAVLERNEDVETVTIALSDMLEYITYEKTEQVLFSQELVYMNSYLEIQRRRYNDKFSIEYHIEDNARSCLLNKLLVQPIVENAINHGFSQLLENGLLIISAYVSAHLLIIEVADNGIGMDMHTLSELIQRINTPTSDSSKKSIGLSNIQERIHMKYGPSYGLTIMSQEGSGTRVILRIPAQYEGGIYCETEDLTD